MISSSHAFAYPAFRRYYIGAVLGTNGGWISRVVMAWLAWDLTGSATFVGLIAAASLMPVALFGPIFGAIIDRMETRRAFRRVTLALVLVPMVLTGLLAFGLLGPGALLATALGFGIVMSAYHPVRQSIGPRLVEREAIGSVVALAALNFNIGRLLAPALGGAMIAGVGILPTAALGVVMVLPNALIAPTLTPREDAAKAPTRLLADLTEGFRLVLSRVAILRPMLFGMLGLGLVRGMAEILALVADGEFQRGATGLGLMISCVGGGALFAALVKVALPTRNMAAPGRIWPLMLLGFGAVLGLTMAPIFELALIPAALIGFVSTNLGVSMQVAVQSDLEDHMRGRVMSIWMLANTGGASAMAFGLSALSDLIGLDLAAVIMVGLAAVAVSVAALKTR